MPRSRKIRRRPSTPNLQLANEFQPEDYQHPHTADPASPPETPTTSSPPAARKTSLKPRHQPDFRDFFQPLSQDPNIRPFGNGHQFSYQPTLNPDQLSPRSSSSSSNGNDDMSDDASSESASIENLPNGMRSAGPAEDADQEDNDGNDDDTDVELSESESTDKSADSSPFEEGEISHLTAATTCNFTLEDIDPMDSDCEGLDVLRPTEIESNRSRSRSRHNDHLDRGMMDEFRNLKCSNLPSDNEDEDADLNDEAMEAFLRRKEQLKKFRRMSMGSSFGKRSHSELSDSDNDAEALDVNDVGSSARRLRRKLHRTSLLFQDPPQDRIDELDEPDSSEDDLSPGSDLARELPYWTMEIMDMDSS